jgi:UDP-glucose:(heptosyl)LPS alpha-1,3-glucosyltransferase
MNVAFCLFKYFPYGGLQRDFVRIAQECQRRGGSIVVYTLSWDGPIPEGFDVRIVPVKALSNHRRAQKFAAYVQSELNDYKSGLGAVDLRSLTSDLLLIGFNKIPGLDVYYAADACYKEKSLTQRGWFYRLGARYRIYAAFEEAVFGKDSKTEILMISKTQEPFFVKHYGTQVSRMHFLPPNISKDRIAPPNASEIRAVFRQKNGLAEDVKLLVQIGSGFIKKGLDRSIRALAALPLDVREKTVLWVVGKDRKKRFEKQARTLGVGDRVVFTGGRDDIPAILLGADLMIHPAYDENTGTVLLEAVAAGLPVLCTEVCGYGSHIQAAGCGLLTPEPFDQAVLNWQLEALLIGGDLPKLGKNALAYAQSTDLYSMHERAADVIFEQSKPVNFS